MTKAHTIYLRDICNSRGISCRGPNGGYLANKTLEKLLNQSGGTKSATAKKPTLKQVLKMAESYEPIEDYTRLIAEIMVMHAAAPINKDIYNKLQRMTINGTDCATCSPLIKEIDQLTTNHLFLDSNTKNTIAPRKTFSGLYSMLSTLESTFNAPDDDSVQNNTVGELFLDLLTVNMEDPAYGQRDAIHKMIFPNASALDQTSQDFIKKLSTLPGSANSGGVVKFDPKLHCCIVKGLYRHKNDFFSKMSENAEELGKPYGPAFDVTADTFIDRYENIYIRALSCIIAIINHVYFNYTNTTKDRVLVNLEQMKTSSPLKTIIVYKSFLNEPVRTSSEARMTVEMFYQDSVLLLVNKLLLKLIDRSTQSMLANRAINADSGLDMSIKWEILRPTLGRFIDRDRFVKARNIQFKRSRGLMTGVSDTLTNVVSYATLGIVAPTKSTGSTTNVVDDGLNILAGVTSYVTGKKVTGHVENPLFNDMRAFLVRSKDVLATISRLKAEIFRQSRKNEKKLRNIKHQMRSKYNNPNMTEKQIETTISSRDPLDGLIEKVLDTSATIALGYYCVWKYYKLFTGKSIIQYHGERTVTNSVDDIAEETMFSIILEYVSHDSDNIIAGGVEFLKSYLSKSVAKLSKKVAQSTYMDKIEKAFRTYEDDLRDLLQDLDLAVQTFRLETDTRDNLFDSLKQSFYGARTEVSGLDLQIQADPGSHSISYDVAPPPYTEQSNIARDQAAEKTRPDLLNPQANVSWNMYSVTPIDRYHKLPSTSRLDRSTSVPPEFKPETWSTHSGKFPRSRRSQPQGPYDELKRLKSDSRKKATLRHRQSPSPEPRPRLDRTQKVGPEVWQQFDI